jgi:hypothetical protein
MNLEKFSGFGVGLHGYGSAGGGAFSVAAFLQERLRLVG